MTLGGYADNVARINLTSGEISYEAIPEDYKLKYIGARGLGVRYLLDGDPTVDPLSPENKLTFFNGPLTGSKANMSGRLAVVTKSPLTNTVTDSHQGGWAAARLRWSGFDGLIFEGASETPVYAYIEDGTVELRDATPVWGKNVLDTVAYFQEQYGEKDLTVITIGEAGENLVKFAAWMNEDARASGRGGTGAVGGAKKLKALVIKAKKNFPQPVDAEGFKAANKAALANIMDESNITSPKKGGLSVYGTNMLMNAINANGSLPAHNSQDIGVDYADQIGGEHFREFLLVGEPTCHACPVACKKEVEVTFRGLTVRTESVEYETAWAFGANSGNKDANAIGFMVYQCNDFGVDTIEMGNVLATYMEICQHGWNDDVTLEWGDAELMTQLVELTVRREGIGDKLAEGVLGLAKAFGHPEVAMAVRGQSIPAYDPRGQKGMGIGYATSNRGGCHLRAYATASELGVIEPVTDPLAYEGKGELIGIFQNIHAFSDSLDLCKFSAFAQSPNEYAAMYAAMTGREFTAEDVLAAGARIYTLERYYNQLAGDTPANDTIPTRFLEEPSKAEASLGHVCELEPMLEEYYAFRGWENGIVSDDNLRAVGILD